MGRTSPALTRHRTQLTVIPAAEHEMTIRFA